MRIEYHFHATASIVAGALVSRGVPPDVAVRVAHNDADLAHMSGRVFFVVTGQVLPAFTPYKPGSDGWRRWCA